ncbi:MAG: DUF3536 domain-containing protein [Candidatus Moduliflexus flocculans]|nr:DUF3536 domain-containing protein [Candidatus Moduliflexus flocculans]
MRHTAQPGTVELHPQSAWACSHGVGRWCEDCGCSAGGGPGWNQAWRRPLRQGLDRLRDALAAIFQEEGASLLRDPWAARDDYIDLLLDGSQTARDDFFQRHRAHALDGAEWAALRLLEMQHHAMLMFTMPAPGSSPTFPASRPCRTSAMPPAPSISRRPLRTETSRRCSWRTSAAPRATWPSTTPDDSPWEREVRPSRVGPEEAVARLLAHGVLGRGVGPQVRYRWALAPGPIRQDQDLLLAGIRATSEVTGEALHFVGACRRDGPFDFLAGVGPWLPQRGLGRLCRRHQRRVRPERAAAGRLERPARGPPAALAQFSARRPAGPAGSTPGGKRRLAWRLRRPIVR